MDVIAAPETPSAADTEPVLSPQQKAEKLIKEHILWSVGGGLIPVPLFDISAIIAAQIRMIAKMSEAYSVPFSEHRCKNVLMPLIASIGVVPIGTAFVSSAVKVVPVVGTLVGAVSMPVVAGATTYSVGKVFLSHFEAGGTLLDFKPDETKKYFAELYDEGKEVATRLKKSAAEKK